jgi:hypothetical protein
MSNNILKDALEKYEKEGKFHSSLSTYKKDGYQDLIEYLNDNGANYGETSIVGNDMVIYNADQYDSGLRRLHGRMRNLKHLDEAWEMPKLKRDRAKVKGSSKYKSYGSWTKVLGGKNLMAFESFKKQWEMTDDEIKARQQEIYDDPHAENDLSRPYTGEDVEEYSVYICTGYGTPNHRESGAYSTTGTDAVNAAKRFATQSNNVWHGKYGTEWEVIPLRIKPAPMRNGIPSGSEYVRDEKGNELLLVPKSK